MKMAYTDDEIQAAVDSVTLTTIQRNVDSLGVPQVGQTFSDVQEAAIGIFLLYQTAPFYVISLGVQRLVEELITHVTNVQALQQAILNAGRRVLPVTNLTPLSNASAALFSLDSAVASRGSSFGNIQDTPAYQQFSKNVDAFLQQNGNNIKQGGDVVQTPQEAKGLIPNLLAAVLSIQADVVQKAGYLQNALKDYSSLNLPSVAAQGVIGRVTQVVASLLATLTPKTPTDRLQDLRLGILNLLTSRAALGQIGSFKTPSSIFSATGAATAFADASHPATPAIVKADLFAPYNITGNPTLGVALDGGAATSVSMPDSIYAGFDGTALEPFTFVDASAPQITGTVPGTYNITGANDSFIFFVADAVTGQSVMISASLTHGATQTVGDVLVDIGSALGAAHLGGQYSVATIAGSIQLAATASGATKKIIIGSGTANATLGFTAGQTATGTDSNLQFQVSINGAPALSMNLLPGAGSATAAAVAAQIVAAFGPDIFAEALGSTGSQYVSIRYQGTNPFTAKISFPTANNPAAAVLGLLTGISVSAKQTTARQVAKNIQQLFGTSLVASSEVVPIANGSGLLMRSEPSDPSMVVVYKARGSSTVTPGVGTTLTMVDPSASFVTAGVLVGDVLVFRDGVNLNTKWTITAVTSTSVTASGIASATGGSATYEIGPNLPVLSGYVVEVPTGLQNGTYTIQTVGPTTLAVPFELELDQILPGFQSAALLPRFFTGNVGQERLTIASTSTGESTAIALSGTAVPIFFNTAPTSAVGTTSWVELPAVVPDLAEGDTLEEYASVYNVASSTFPLQSVTDSIISIAPAEVSIGKVFNLAQDTPPPFSLLRSTAYTKYAALTAALATWAALPQLTSTFSKEMQRLINIVLNEPNPVPDQVNAALTKVQSLLDILTQAGSATPSSALDFILSQYTVDAVPQVDALVRTYSEKGSDRAVDTLLSGQFSAFFGLDVHQVSYAGAMLDQMRSVARSDLAVRRTGRVTSRTSPVVSSTSTTDFEYDNTSIESTSLVDVPTELERVPPGANSSVKVNT